MIKAPQDNPAPDSAAARTAGGHDTAARAPWDPTASALPADWERLIEMMGPASLLVVIESRLGPRLARHVTPEDVLQDALLHAWRDRGQCAWCGPKAFRSWLLTIIDRRILDLADHYSAAKRGGGREPLPLERPATPLQSGAMSWGPACSATPSRAAEVRERAACMREALAALPAELRDVVALRLFEQLPIETIAQRLGVGESAVRHRFRKGAEIYHRRLRAALATISIRKSQQTVRTLDSTDD